MLYCGATHRISKALREIVMFNTCKWFYLLSMFALLTACGGGDDDYWGGSNTPRNTAAIKISPVSPDAPPVSVLVDTDVTDDEDGTGLDPLDYGQTAVFGMTPGVTGLALRGVVPVDANSSKYEALLEPFEIDVAEGIRYEVFIGGSYPDLERWITETPLAYDEDETHARLTLVNASQALPAMDVYLTPVDETITPASLISSLDYRESDNSVRVEPGDYRLQITAEGATEVVYTSEPVSFGANMDLSLVAMDNAWIKVGLTDKSPIVLSRSGASGSSRLVFSSDAKADLRVVHAWSDGGPLDVAMATDAVITPFESDLELGEVTPYRTVDAGVYEFQVGPIGGTATVTENFNLLEAVSWTMITTPPADAESTVRSLVFASENARKVAAYSRLRLMHASDAAGRLDIYITPPGADLAEENDEGELLYPPLGAGLGLRNTSSYLAIESGSYDLTFTRNVPEDETPPATPEVIYGPVSVTLAKGEVYTLLLRDQADQTTVVHQWLDGAPETAVAP